MEFGGFVKNSFVDFPGVISSVVFTAGCNFNCWYCHNQGLINGEIKGHIHETEVLDFLISRKGFIDGLVISGGEPTLHLGLKAFIQKVKDLGLLIKLDTNGTNPKLLKELLEENLVDFVAMDIKTSFDNYANIAGCATSIANIKESIGLVMQKARKYEFRTTFSPDIEICDIEKIAEFVKGAQAYAIQKYNPHIDENITRMPHKKETFVEALDRAKKFVHNSFLRGF